MIKFFAILAMAACLFALAVADDADVMVLTDANFDETISSNDYVFVEFYAPWCGHCKNLAPDWAKLATHFKQQGSSVIIAKLDATENSKAANANGVRGYPTLIFFKNGAAIKYEQDRSLQALINWVNKKSGPASVELKTQEQLDAFIAKGAVIAYVAAGEDSVEMKNWMRAATSGQLEDFNLGHVYDAKLRGDKSNTVYIYKSGEEALKYPEESMTKTKIVTWIQNEGYPLYEELSQAVWQRSQNANKPILAVFAEQSATPLVATLAKKYKGKVIVTLAVLPAQKSLAERWGASGKVFPTAIFADWKGMTSPTMTVFNEDEEKDGFTEASAINFVDSALADKYQTFLKSEPVPEKQDSATTVIVGKTFDKIVMDKEKDVFVEFYAPWCGHCKKLAPVWDELAEKFEKNPHITIAKIDGTANTLPKSVNVRGYPTLIFYPANNKAGVPYNGERDLENLAKFVKEQSTKPIKDDL